MRQGRKAGANVYFFCKFYTLKLASAKLLRKRLQIAKIDIIIVLG